MLSTTIFAISSRTSTDRAAEMRRQHDVRHLEQRSIDLGLVLEHVEAGAGDPRARKRAHQRSLVDDRPARGVDQECSLLHQRELARADLVAGLRP